MNELLRVVEFLFIPGIALGLVAAVLAGLFAIGALFDALENPDALRQRIEGAFRKPPQPAKPPSDDHYYKPHWQQSS